MTFTVTTLSTMAISIRIKKCDTQHNGSVMLSVITLDVVMLNVVMLSVVAPLIFKSGAFLFLAGNDAI